ncbi:MAG: 4-hydroxybenzoate octaprenyltransferase, partial [Chitinophagaceae bacterium]
AFDRQTDLYSIPAVLGKTNALLVSRLLHVFSALCIIAAGWYGHFGWLYITGTMLFISMLFYQHSIVKPNDLSRVNIAFMTANGTASVVFGILVISDVIFH